MGKLDGKVALITGAGSGIGQATALIFAQEGAKVAVGDWSERKAADTAAQLSRLGAEFITIKANVSQAADAQRMVAETVNRFGRLDILYNNAGIGAPVLLHNMSEEDWDRVLDVDLKGVFLGCKYALPELKKRGGVILSTSSVFGLEGASGWGHYNAAKAGVVMLTKNIAMDYAKYGIRANCICPGTIDTQGSLGAFNRTIPEDAQRARQMTIDLQPLGRAGRPEEIGRTAVFLCSDDASFITGQAIVVDGGWLAGHSMPMSG